MFVRRGSDYTRLNARVEREVTDEHTLPDAQTRRRSRNDPPPSAPRSCAVDGARDQRCVVERCVDILEPLDESLRTPFLSASSLDILRPDGVPSFTIDGELPLSLPGWLLSLEVVSRLRALRPVLSWLARTPSLFRALRGETALPSTLPLFASLERFVSDDDAELPFNER